jgi:uncharacterized YigZ family protein
MTDIFKTIVTETDGFFADKGSKFYAFAFPVEDELQIKEKIACLRKRHHAARHFVYAFILRHDKSHFRCSDDGEPTNSAGQPVLGQIRAFDITNTLIVVVRYFGGTKLGIPGLINAYKSAALDVLNKVIVKYQFLTNILNINCTYDDINFVLQTVSKFDATILEQHFEVDCQFKISVRQSFCNNFIKEIDKNYKILIQKITPFS